ncbi:hypothetical protein ACI2UK_13875 [Ralstonia nicotianae]|uniref:hypothetical protein n=1 Tax=Ralstonia pseudosolanacearum TaxID=1310165 RepID=UPI002005A0C5|nr:hypothetical protein [Ralstonia pseudosolanacearum]MCK4118368.1 hypothetical protein [Ralstonia pseudosolanacearum]
MITTQIGAIGDTVGCPVLILLERDDKTVYGVRVHGLPRASNAVHFAALYAERDDVENVLDLLMLMRCGDTFMGWIKVNNVACNSLAGAIEAVPELDQQLVMLYRSDEWLAGAWTRQTTSPCTADLALIRLTDYRFSGSRAVHQRRDAASCQHPMSTEALVGKMNSDTSD